MKKVLLYAVISIFFAGLAFADYTDNSDYIGALEKAILEKNEEAVKQVLKIFPDSHDFFYGEKKYGKPDDHILDIAEKSGLQKIKNLVYEALAPQTADSAHYRYAIINEFFETHKEFIQYSLNKKYKPFVYDCVNDNVVRYTLLKGNVPLLKFLMECGLKPAKAGCLNGLASDKGFYKEVPYDTKKEIIQLLIKNGDNPNVVDYKKRPELKDLLRYCDDLEFVYLLIENGASIKKIPGALMDLMYNSEFTADEKGMRFVELLIEKGADVNYSDDDRSVLYQAFWLDKKDGKLIEVLLKNGASTKESGKRTGFFDYSPILQCLWVGNYEGLKLLEQYGANLKGYRILSDAASSPSDNVDCLKLVLTHNPNIEDNNKNSTTPYWDASWRGNPSIMRYLHSLGANVNTISNDGKKQTGFMSYLERMAEEPFRFTIEPVIAALECGADLTMKDAKGKTVKDYAMLVANAATDPEKKKLVAQMISAIDNKMAEKGIDRKVTIYDCVSMGDNKQLEELLKTPDVKSKIDVADNNGLTALDYAVNSNNSQAVKILLNNGASYSKKQIMNAIDKKQSEILKAFFQGGVNVNISLFNKDFKNDATYFDQTAIFYAINVREIDKDVIMAILSAKPDLSKNIEGHSFLYHLASKYHYNFTQEDKCEVIKASIRAGADPFQNNGEFFLKLFQEVHEDHSIPLVKFIAKDMGMYGKFYDSNGKIIWYGRDRRYVIYEKAVKETYYLGRQMKLKENLKLRTDYYSWGNASYNLLGILKAGTKVKVLELSEKAEIDDMNEFWVKVEVLEDCVSIGDGKSIPTGTTGYCYSGYLE
ncbi:ankyrin repeat domain-containing protein [Treponema sp.]|uniref:ankyrin repeat domain-containing protein n=1 Tax=Treponema sp. TaxID=166 RepID=UPI00298D9D9A|nr:ankyrin repeat domain-containing protein [Treponema sp.]MCQ2239998.1 ankyrin repeat domain-containing protein [Treponema sp.]